MSDNSYNQSLLQAVALVATEVLLCVLLFVVVSQDNLLGFYPQEYVESKSECYDGAKQCTFPPKTMTLFVSQSTTQNWSNEYAIIVILQQNYATVTRIIDMSHLQNDEKKLFRKHKKDFLHMSTCSAEDSVKNGTCEIPDSRKAASVISKLLLYNTNTDLHKIPMNGMRILYLTMYAY